MVERLVEGQQAPDFQLRGADGASYQLASFRGKTLVLYFYPKDDTPGCTIEALDFTALKGKFAAQNAVVVGVSPDGIDDHQQFCHKHSLQVLLLSDPGNLIAERYAAYGEKNKYGKITVGIIRSTFVIREEKVVRAFYNVQALGHAQRVLESL